MRWHVTRPVLPNSGACSTRHNGFPCRHNQHRLLVGVPCPYLFLDRHLYTFFARGWGLCDRRLSNSKVIVTSPFWRAADFGVGQVLQSL